MLGKKIFLAKKIGIKLFVAEKVIFGIKNIFDRKKSFLGEEIVLAEKINKEYGSAKNITRYLFRNREKGMSPVCTL